MEGDVRMIRSKDQSYHVSIRSSSGLYIVPRSTVLDCFNFTTLHNQYPQNRHSIWSTHSSANKIAHFFRKHFYHLLILLHSPVLSFSCWASPQQICHFSRVHLLWSLSHLGSSALPDFTSLLYHLRLQFMTVWAELCAAECGDKDGDRPWDLMREKESRVNS